MHVGVIGSGAWSRVHLGAMAASPAVGRITLASRNPVTLAQRAEQFAVAATATDYRRVLDDPTVDAVSIVLPHDQHAEVGAAALAAGKHVICEKPAGRNPAEFDRLLDAARASGRRLLVVMNQLYNPLPLHVRALLEQGTIGRPFLSVENSFANHAADYRDPTVWRTTIERSGGGVFIDGGYHMVYRHLFQLEPWGPPGWVSADVAQLAIDAGGARVPAKGEDFIAVTVGYPHALRIQWCHGWSLAAEPARRRQSFIAGTEATLEFTDERDSPLVLHRDGRAESVFPPPGPWSSIETTQACLLDYLDCLASDRQPAHASIELARLTLHVICGAYSASEAQARLPLQARP